MLELCALLHVQALYSYLSHPSPVASGSHRQLPPSKHMPRWAAAPHQAQLHAESHAACLSAHGVQVLAQQALEASQAAAPDGQPTGAAPTVKEAASAVAAMMQSLPAALDNKVGSGLPCLSSSFLISAVLGVQYTWAYPQL